MIESLIEFLESNTVLATALLGILAFLLRERYNRRRTVRKVLYHLLNLYWSQSRLISFESIARRESSEFVVELANDLFPTETKDSVQDAIQGVDSIIRRLVDNSKKLFFYPIPDFRDDLKALALDYPILAYKLRGTEEIAQRQEMCAELLEECVLETGNHSLHEVLENALSATIDPLEELSDGIKSTAWKAGILTYLKVIFNTLPKAKAPDSKSSEDFRKQFAQLKTQIKRAIQAKLDEEGS